MSLGKPSQGDVAFGPRPSLPPSAAAPRPASRSPLHTDSFRRQWPGGAIRRGGGGAEAVGEPADPPRQPRLLRRVHHTLRGGNPPKFGTMPTPLQFCKHRQLFNLFIGDERPPPPPFRHKKRLSCDRIQSVRARISGRLLAHAGRLNNH